jgi:hypothetical protein
MNSHFTERPHFPLEIMERRLRNNDLFGVRGI